MKDQFKTKQALIQELASLIQKIERLEQSESEWKKEKEELRKGEARFRNYFALPLHGIAITSPEKGWIEVNDQICFIMGYSRDEIVRMTWSEMTHPDDLAADIKQFNRVLSGQIENYNMDKRFIRKGGTVVWTNLSVGCVRKSDGTVDHIIAMVDDITDSKRIESIMRTRLRLLEFANSHSMDELLTATLDEIEALTESTIGFYHFVESDQKTLSLQNWSTNTIKNMCTAEGKGSHYDVDQAGVWVDCVHERRPVIQNDYASLPHRKGMPEGHAPVIREIVVPIFRGDQIKAIIGVGNKSTNYDDSDIEIVSQLGDLSWDITERKRTEEELRRLNRELRAISNCKQTLLQAVDEQTLLNDICRIVCDEAGYRMVWVGYTENDDAKTVRPVAWAGHDSGYIKNVKFSWADDMERKRGLAGKAIRSGETICVQDFITDPQMSPWRESALQHGYRSGTALPLKDENANVFGVLLIYSAEVNAITPDEIRLMEELAGDLAFGITTLRARIERKRAENELRINEGRYRMAEAIGHVGNWEYNLQTTTFWGSDEAKRIYGFDPEALDFSTDEVEGCIPERERVHQALVDLIEADKRYNLEFEIHPKNSLKPRIIASVAEVKRDEQGNPLLVSGVIQDITERKQLESLLTESEERYRHLFETASDGIVLLEKHEGKIINTNPAAEKMLGYSKKDIMGNKLQDIGIFDIDDFPMIMHNLNKDGIINYTDVLATTKSGQQIDTDIYLVDRAKLVQCNIRDITYRIRIERALAENEARLRTLVQTIPDLIWLKDADGIYLACNQRFECFFGTKEAVIVGKTDYDFVDRELADFFREHDRKAMAAGKPSANEEWLTSADDGYRGLFDTIKTPMYDATGKLIGVLGIARDVSERYRAEEEHKAHIRFLESLERIDQAIKEATDVEQMLRHILQAVFVIFDCDRAWLFYPCDPDAPTFRVPMEICRPEYPGAQVLNVDVPMSPDMAQNLREALASDDPVICITGTEKPINKVTVEQFGVQSQMFVALYPKLDKPWVFGMHQCSYPRIWTEEEQKLFKQISRRLSDGLSSVLYLRELQKNEARLSEGQRLAHIGNWEWDAITDTITWSKEYCRIYGFDPTQPPPGYEEHLKVYTPESAVQLDAAVKTNMQTGEPYELDLELANPKGPCRWITARSETMRNAQGKIIGLRGTAQDITERKQAEGALLNSEQKLKAVLYGSPIPQFVIGRDHQVVYWNNALEEITGIRASEVIGTNQHWRAFYPEERPCLADLMIDETIEKISELYQGKYGRSKIVAGAYEATDYFPTLGENGKWLFFTAVVIMDVSGQAIGVLETLEDVTERKKAEKEIFTLSITDQLTGLHNRRGFIMLANQQLKLSGRTKKGMLLFFTDLDGLKWINDTLGHEEGDKALVEVAAILKETFRSVDIIARMGGDEFAVLSIDSTEESFKIFTTRFQEKIDIHNHHENRKYKLSISVGSSCYDPENPSSLDELMAHADRLMYEHKRVKKSCL